MSVQKAEFFEQATEHLLKTLNLQEGLGQLLSYLSTVMPCQEIRLATYFMQEQGSANNLHLRASLTGTSTYYGPLLSKARLDEMISLKNHGGELIRDPHHPLVIFCRTCSTNVHPPMPLPWYDIVLWDKSRPIGECRFSGPFSPEELKLLDALRPVLCIAVSNYQKCQELENNLKDAQRENQRLKRSLHTSQARDILQDQLGLQQVIERTGLVAMHDIPVLVTGETGSGKELIARMIHEQSPRHDGPFIALNCGAIPSALIDSELFGHRKGSFTGAMRDHKGYFERADGGTLFLDEVGELPMDMQARLLRVLQEQEIVPVGASRPIRINTRIVAATNQDLPAMIEEGKFRADLYFRLNGAHIVLPPLRERLTICPSSCITCSKSSAGTSRFPPCTWPTEKWKSSMPIPGRATYENCRTCSWKPWPFRPITSTCASPATLPQAPPRSVTPHSEKRNRYGRRAPCARPTSWPSITET